MASKLSKKDIDLLSAYKQKKETPKYTGKVLGVGISYDKDTKEHKCIIETLSK